jgi:hypothetical protein
MTEACVWFLLDLTGMLHCPIAMCSHNSTMLG